MATKFFRSIYWSKIQSFLKGKFDWDDHHAQEAHPTPQSSAAATSSEMFDLEAQQEASDFHGRNMNTSPSSSLYSSPTSMFKPTPKPPSNSPGPQKEKGVILLPIFTRSSSSSLSNVNSSPGVSQPGRVWGGGGPNPISQIFNDQDLGRTIIGFVMPLTAAFLTPYAPTSLVRTLVILSVSLGLAATVFGILVRHVLPRQANFIEQLGVAFVLLAYYGLVTSFLPAGYVQWIPWACFVVLLLPFFWGYCLGNNPEPEGH